jgi:hypothetical protein
MTVLRGKQDDVYLPLRYKYYKTIKEKSIKAKL